MRRLRRTSRPLTAALALVFALVLLGGAIPASAALPPVGTITLFPTPQAVAPGTIASGPDGALWFTAGESIGRVTTSGAFTMLTDPLIVDAVAITRGPDGAMWFADFGNDDAG